MLRIIEGTDKDDSAAWHGELGKEAYLELLPLKQQIIHMTLELLRTYQEDTGKALDELEGKVQGSLAQPAQATHIQFQEWVRHDWGI